AIPELGKHGSAFGEEFQTLRQTDNRFYWLSSDGIKDSNIVDPQNLNRRVIAATMDGRIVGGENNQINVNATGVKQLTVWLSADMRGRLDLGKKPVAIWVNGRNVWNRPIEPNLATLLEDFYLRGDRECLFLARVDFDRL